MPEEASAISNNRCLSVCCVSSSFQVLYRGAGKETAEVNLNMSFFFSFLKFCVRFLLMEV